MKSLKAKFNGNTEKAVCYAKQFGILAAMEEYEVKDYVAMYNFLKENAPDEVFHASKVEVSSYASPGAFDKLIEAMLRKYSQLESKISALADENAELKKQLDYYRANKWKDSEPIVREMFKYCQED